MRRRKDQLIAIEVAILEAGLALHRDGTTEFHGYALARVMRDAAAARRLTAHGTLYRALQRLETAGLIESSWEDPVVGEAEGRPRRRLYRLTGAAEAALARATSRRETSNLRALEPRHGLP